jgi:hypothetical protein
LRFKGLTRGVQVSKLRITVWMRFPLDRLLVDMQGKPLLVEQFGQR